MLAIEMPVRQNVEETAAGERRDNQEQKRRIQFALVETARGAGVCAGNDAECQAKKKKCCVGMNICSAKAEKHRPHSIDLLAD
jgi:hypothetical protein